MLAGPPATPSGIDEPLAPEIVEAHLQRMLASVHFARAETQRKLLAYLWEHRHEPVSEYGIAVDALGRQRNFDPTVDASVRVQISRLRRKIRDYYQQVPAEPELLVIPTGTHQLLVLAPHAEPLAAPLLPAEPSLLPDRLPSPPPPAPTSSRALPLLIALSALLALSVAALLWHTHTLTAQLRPKQEPNAFWADFLEGTAPIRIILPTPVFFNFAGAPSLRIRSTEVNDFSGRDADPRFQSLIAGLGTPGLEQSYTVTWDTLAAIDMARYLDSIGAKDRVSFDVSRDASMLNLEQSNVIMLGTHQTLQPLHEYLAAMNFSLSRNEAWVDNAHPDPGEPARFDIIHESTERRIAPSILAVLPGRAPGLKVLLLQSRNTGALVSLLCSNTGSRSVHDLWVRRGRPRFFEVVVETETEGHRVLRVWPVALHPFRGDAPASTM